MHGTCRVDRSEGGVPSRRIFFMRALEKGFGRRSPFLLLPSPLDRPIRDPPGRDPPATHPGRDPHDVAGAMTLIHCSSKIVAPAVSLLQQSRCSNSADCSNSAGRSSKFVAPAVPVLQQ